MPPARPSWPLHPQRRQREQMGVLIPPGPVPSRLTNVASIRQSPTSYSAGASKSDRQNSEAKMNRAQTLKSRPTLVSDSQPFFRSVYQGPFSETSANLLRSEVRHFEVTSIDVTDARNNPVGRLGAYWVSTPNRVHVAAGQYLYCTSPSTSPRATKPTVRLSRELFRLSPSTKHAPSGTFAWG